MALTYPHTGNDAFDDALIDLIDGVPKYELAYKIVGFCETQRLKGGDPWALPLDFKLQAQGYLYEGLTPKLWAYRVIATLVAKATSKVKEEVTKADEVIDAWLGNDYLADNFIKGYERASVLEELAVAR
jgi:hypothetical protein